MHVLKYVSIGLLLLCPGVSIGKPDKKTPEDAKAQERLTCGWRGAYHYGEGQQSVSFDMVMIQDGATIVGFIKEERTFGAEGAPWLHAVFKGRFDEKTGKLSFTKTYDGTAGPKHDVAYEGELSRDSSKVEGSWEIDGAKGTFTLQREANTRSGPYSGVWSGTTLPSKGSDRKPVSFNMIVIHDGKKIAGFMKEPNTLGKSDEPWLQSGIRGTLDEKTGKWILTKTFDGTAGESGKVILTGEPSRDRTKIDGNWTIRDDERGGFSLQKQKLDAKTLESLK